MSSNDLKKSYIVFVGDAIIDFFSYVDRMPKMGETFNSNQFKLGLGGKAVNACVAASKLSSSTALVCKLGNDIFGKYYLEEMKKNNIKTDYVFLTDESISGTACVMVDKNGYNSIVVNSGTNFCFKIDDIKAAENLISNASILVTNTLINLDAAVYSMKLAKQHNVLTIFNFAACSTDLTELDPEANKYIDILVANEVEAEAFSGCPVVTTDDANNVINLLFDRDGLNTAIIITLGEKGCVWGDKRTKKISYLPCKKVNVVDTTGAGDAFIGTLAHCIFKLGLDQLEKSIELACEYATISVQSHGTQVSYPLLADLDDRFKF